MAALVGNSSRKRNDQILEKNSTDKQSGFEKEERKTTKSDL